MVRWAGRGCLQGKEKSIQHRTFFFAAPRRQGRIDTTKDGRRRWAAFLDGERSTCSLSFSLPPFFCLSSSARPAGWVWVPDVLFVKGHERIVICLEREVGILNIGTNVASRPSKSANEREEAIVLCFQPFQYGVVTPVSVFNLRHGVRLPWGAMVRLSGVE